MKLDLENLHLLCEIAIKAARLSGDSIRSYIGHTFKVQHKRAGSSPASHIVTEVDLKSQAIILDCINPTIEKFNLGLLIEESEDDQSRFEKDYFWCIDPLDGTLPFVQQQPGYAISIALVSREGTALIGVVYDPLTQTLYHAVRHSGAFRNEQPWKLAPNLANNVNEVHKGGSVMNACWVLEQAPAYFLKKPKPEDGGGCLWDYAATVCLYDEMKCFSGTACGERLNLNSRESLFMNRKGVLFASNEDVFNAIKTS